MNVTIWEGQSSFVVTKSESHPAKGRSRIRITQFDYNNGRKSALSQAYIMAKSISITEGRDLYYKPYRLRSSFHKWNDYMKWDTGKWVKRDLRP